MKRRGFLASLLGAPAVAKVAPPLLSTSNRTLTATEVRRRGMRLVYLGQNGIWQQQRVAESVPLMAGSKVEFPAINQQPLVDLLKKLQARDECQPKLEWKA